MAETFSETKCPKCPFPYADYFLSTRTLEESVSCPFCGYYASAERGQEEEGDFAETVVDICLGAYGYEGPRTYGSGPFRSEEHRAEMIARLQEPENGLLAAWYTEKRSDGFFYRIVVRGEPRYAYYENNNPDDGFGVREKEALALENTFRSEDEIAQFDEQRRLDRERADLPPEDDLPF